jgi:hypothetical protein
VSLFEGPVTVPSAHGYGEVVPGEWTPGALYRRTNCPNQHLSLPWFPHGGLQLGIFIKRNGTQSYELWCPLCRCRESARITKALALSWNIPVQYVRHSPGEVSECEYIGCGQPAELHHFAPRNWFGFEEADNWPTAWLCPMHHKEWHRRMNGYRQFAKSIDERALQLRLDLST